MARNLRCSFMSKRKWNEEEKRGKRKRKKLSPYPLPHLKTCLTPIISPLYCDSIRSAPTDKHSSSSFSPFIEAFSTNSSFNCANTLTKLGQFAASEFSYFYNSHFFQTTETMLTKTLPLETVFLKRPYCPSFCTKIPTQMANWRNGCKSPVNLKQLFCGNF